MEVHGQQALAGALRKLQIRRQSPIEPVKTPLQGMVLLPERVKNLLPGMAEMLRLRRPAPEAAESILTEPLGMAAELQLPLAKQLMTNSWLRSEQLL